MLERIEKETGKSIWTILQLRLPKDNINAEKVVRNWVATFFLVIILLQIWRIFSLNATYDQGLFLQEIWNGISGRPFESIIVSY